MDGRSLERGRDRPLTSLIFPTYNPGPVLERTWCEVQQFLHDTQDNWEVLFVCDGCTDDTAARLTELVHAEAQRVRVLSYANNRGKGYAVRHGLALARGDWRIFTDVDLAYSFDDILRLARSLQDGASVAIASRTHPQSLMTLPTRLQGYAYRRHLQSRAFAGVVRLLLPLKQGDTQAGLKGLKAEVAQLVLPHLFCDGFGFDCELLTACVRFGLAIDEVPVTVRYEDQASTTSLGTVASMIGELWRIRRTWRRPPPVAPMEVSEPSRRAA